MANGLANLLLLILQIANCMASVHLQISLTLENHIYSYLSFFVQENTKIFKALYKIISDTDLCFSCLGFFKIFTPELLEKLV